MLDHKEETVDDAPDDKCPGRAVPESAQEHDDHEIDGGAGRPGAIAAERDVEVVAQEGRERDVPSTPEVRKTDRRVWKTEVVLEMEPEAQRCPYRADGIT